MARTVGFSTHDVLVEAAVEAGREVYRDRPKPAVVLLLATHTYPLDQLAAAGAALSELFPPGVQIAGATINGLLYRNVRYDAMLAQQKAVAVVALGEADLPGSRAAAVLVADPTEGPRRAGQELARRARALFGTNIESGMLFSPGLPTDGPPLDQAIADGLRDLEPSIGLSGTGLSGGLDLRGFCEPGVALLDGRVERNGALFLAFEGSGPSVTPQRTAVTIGNGLRRVDAPPLVVTRAEGAHVLTIDNQPAYERVVEAVRRHERVRGAGVGDLDKNLGLTMVERRLAFAVKDPTGEFFWPRIPLRSLPDGSYVDAFEYVTGEELHLVEADEGSCLGAAHETPLRLRESASMGHARFELVVAFSCSIRGFVLGGRSVEENREVGALAHCDDDNVLGVIANGELGTFNGGRPRATGWAYSLFGLGDEGRPGGKGLEGVMGERIQRLIDSIRRAKGPFFVARLNLRVHFALDDPNAPDKEEHIATLLEVSRALGYDAEAGISLPPTGPTTPSTHPTRKPVNR
jgi:hypothetical protein